MFNAVTITLPRAITAPGLDRLVEVCRREGIDLTIDAERIILSAQPGRLLRGADEHVRGIRFEADDPVDIAASIDLARAIAVDGTDACDGDCGYCAQVQDEIAREHARSTERAERFA